MLKYQKPIIIERFFKIKSLATSLTLLATLCLPIHVAAEITAAPNWEWPGGADAAVSFVYDDGAYGQVPYAIDDLEHFGYRGSFYLNGKDGSYTEHVPAWRNAFKNGHEIANHGETHSTPLCDFSNYTSIQIRNHVNNSNQWINQNIGFDSNRTFGYPCGVRTTSISGAYETAVRSIHFAAKGGQQELNNPYCVGRNPIGINTMGFNPNDRHTLATVKSWIDEAVNKRGWAVISFHALYDPNNPNDPPPSSLTLPWTKQGHWSAIQYLNRYSEDHAGKKVWVAPMKEVARYILDQYPRYVGPYCE